MLDSKLAAYLTAIIIALAGLGFLIAAVSYLIYLPIPSPLQPLKQRIIITLQMEERAPIFISLREDVDKIVVFKEPDKDSEEITTLPPGGSYRLLSTEEGWYKIRVTEDIKGWIKKEVVLE